MTLSTGFGGSAAHQVARHDDGADVHATGIVEGR
jgi:hypothetical protein